MTVLNGNEDFYNIIILEQPFHLLVLLLVLLFPGLNQAVSCNVNRKFSRCALYSVRK